MALSMEEQRILDEMERRLSDDDPRLASRLATLGRPGLTGSLRSPTARLVTVAVAAALAVAVLLMLYTTMPFRTAPVRPRHPHAAVATSLSRPAHPRAGAGARPSP